MNRDLGRKGSTETAPSDRAPSGPEKTTSTSDRSAAAEGDRPSSTAEGAGRKERSTSAERGASKERPGSAGERLQGSDREQKRSSGQDRERDRASGSDRDRGMASDRERERERDRVSGSGSQKVAVPVEKDTEGEGSVRTERKNSNDGSAGGRAVSLDKLTIGEKSAVTKKVADHQEKPSISSKERGEGSERAAKSDRSVTFVSLLLVKPPSISKIERKHFIVVIYGSVNTFVNTCNYILSFPRSVSKDRTERSAPSGEKPAAAHRDGNLNLCVRM